MLLLAPSRAFLDRLPNRNLPGREDFHRYGQDHRARIRDWECAIAECERFAENAMRWLQRPDVAQVRSIRGLAVRRRRRGDVAGLRSGFARRPRRARWQAERGWATVRRSQDRRSS